MLPDFKRETKYLEDIPWVGYRFFTRLYNAREDADRAFAAQDIGVAAERLVTPKQIHSDKVITVTEPWARADAPEGDALVTNVPGLAIGVMTADCAPVLFASKDQKVVGAAHAGWKGALEGVLERTIDAMEALGAAREGILAALGPCIGAQSYEVDAAYLKPFLAQDGGNSLYFQDRGGEKFLFDLPAYILSRLKRAGITIVCDETRDTVVEEDRYFSHRRCTQRGVEDDGRQISLVVIRDQVL